MRIIKKIFKVFYYIKDNKVAFTFVFSFFNLVLFFTSIKIVHYFWLYEYKLSQVTGEYTAHMQMMDVMKIQDAYSWMRKGAWVVLFIEALIVVLWVILKWAFKNIKVDIDTYREGL